MLNKHYKVLVVGGLGNQLFQYAFGLSLHREKQAPYLLINENRKHKLIIHKYFELPHFNFLANFLLNKLVSKQERLHPEVKIENDQNYTEQKHKITHGKVIHGYFQSPSYFRNVEPILLSQLRVKKCFLNSFENSFLKKQTKSLLAIHIRGGDYKDNSNHLLPSQYYNNCLKRINNVKKYNVYIISDDIEYASGMLLQFNIDPKNVHIEKRSMIDDFLIMYHSQVLIISNSTFSWWAAYLNDNAKRVFAPKYWLGQKDKKEYPNGIMDTDFTWI